MQNDKKMELVEVEVEERKFELSQRMLSPYKATAMIPAHLRDLGSLMILDKVSKRYNMDLLFLAQEMYIVKGKFAISGKMAIALINKSGELDGRLKFEVRSNPFGVRAYGVIDGEKVYGMWIDDQLIKANGWERNPLWVTQKELMARYRSATYFARMEMPEVLMGFHTTDEVEDTTNLEVPKIAGGLNQVIVEDVSDDIIEASEEQKIEETSSINGVVEESNVIDGVIEEENNAPGTEEDEKKTRTAKSVTSRYEEMIKAGFRKGHLAKLVEFYGLCDDNIDKFMENINHYKDEFYASHSNITPADV